MSNAETMPGSLMSNKFIEIDRTKPINLAGDMDGWLDQNSLARFVVEVVEQLDTQDIEKAYSGEGSDPYRIRSILRGKPINDGMGEIK